MGMAWTSIMFLIIILGGGLMYGYMVLPVTYEVREGLSNTTSILFEGVEPEMLELHETQSDTVYSIIVYIPFVIMGIGVFYVIQQGQRGGNVQY